MVNILNTIKSYKYTMKIKQVEMSSLESLALNLKHQRLIIICHLILLVQYLFICIEEILELNQLET